MGAVRELLVEMLDAIREDPELRDELRDALGMADQEDGWLSAPDAVEFLGLGSLDALDRLVRDGLPCAQPSGPGGRRYFSRLDLDRWLRDR